MSDPAGLRIPPPLSRLVTALAACLLAGCSLVGGDDHSSIPGEPRQRIARHGVSIALPPGWSGRIYSRQAPPRGRGVILHAANFRLPARDDDVATKAIARMTPQSVLILFLETGGEHSGAARRRALRIGREDFLRGFDGVPRDLAFARVSFAASGRLFEAWVLIGARPAPPPLVQKANEALATLVVASRAGPTRARRFDLGAPVPLVPLAEKKVVHCRESLLVRPACPTLVPRVGAAFLSHLYAAPAPPKWQFHSFGLERGGEWPGRPERNRPPRMAHIDIVAGRVEGSAHGVFDYGDTVVALRNGLMRRDRMRSLYFGRVWWAGRAGDLLLAPAHPRGGVHGNHLIFRWGQGGVDFAVSLHAWEPLREAAATPRTIVESIPPTAPPRGRYDESMLLEFRLLRTHEATICDGGCRTLRATAARCASTPRRIAFRRFYRCRVEYGRQSARVDTFCASAGGRRGYFMRPAEEC